jgi:hypothetical protein
MYHFSLDLRQKISSERKFQRPGTRQKQNFWKPLVDLILGKMNIFLYWLAVLVWRDLNRISWFLSGI